MRPYLKRIRLTLLIPAFRKQRQADCWEFEASLLYIAKFWDSRRYIERPCLKIINKYVIGNYT